MDIISVEVEVADANLLRAFTSGYMPATATNAERLRELLSNIVVPEITGARIRGATKTGEVAAAAPTPPLATGQFKVGKVYTAQTSRPSYRGMRFRVEKINGSTLSCTYLDGGRSNARWAVPGHRGVRVPKPMLDASTEADK